MAKRKRKTEMEEATGIVLGFANLVDTLFLRYTGKTMGTLLKEFQQRPRELPAGERIATTEPDMPLADAYMTLGLPATATIDQVKERYRALARLYHPDLPTGYAEAMRLLNRAHERVMKEKKK
jgi:DnaJ-domain-containing protein 1